ncbi:MAG: heavy metal transporter [Acidobacteria bacterium SCN 69-37]|nr:MAG: heavy metal transporter [Acidobacteria bacterium SCN 69-37]
METPPQDTPATGFDTLGLTPALVSAVTALGYEEATPIQRAAIPVLLAGHDLVGQAGTGTGKTAAFALPLIHRLATNGPRPASGRARGLILVPTRELAMQVAEAVHKYAKGSNLPVVPLYGGASMEQQIRALRRGAAIIVATPGRALDHLRRQTLELGDLEMLVLDEADEMLDMGFADDLDAILEATPTTRQTALFAATMAPRILAVAARHLRDPQRITIGREKRAAGKLPRVRQTAYFVAREHKLAALGRVLDFEAPKSAIVFCRTRVEVDEATDTLTAHGYSAQALHGGMEQRQRDRVMQLFRSEQADVLVATDVAARGLDIDHVSHVINLDVPSAPEVYVHRIGRTGRAGREGLAISLAEPREHRFLRNIQTLTKQKIDIQPLPTVADLEARRLESTHARVREILEQGGLDRMRDVVLALAQDFDVIDIAAAAVKMVHEAETTSALAATHVPAPGETRDTRARGEKPTRERSASRARRTADPDDTAWVTLWVGAGKRTGIGPGDLVGAIAGEADVDKSAVGAIKITDGFSLVQVDAELASRIIAALKHTKIRGQKVQVRRDRA